MAWAPGAVYCDPLDRVEGRDALSRHIAATQVALAGGRIAVTSTPVRHHDSAFFRWTMTDAAGAVALTGFDVVQLDDDGRIARLHRLLRHRHAGGHADGHGLTAAVRRAPQR